MMSRIFLPVAAFAMLVAPVLSAAAGNATVSLSVSLGRTDTEVTHEWFPISFEGSFAVKPLFFAGIQTTNGGDPATLRYKNLSTSGVEVFVEEEQSKDKETNHVPEQVGYLTMDHPGYIQDENGTVIGEAGWLTINQKNKKTWYTVGLRGSYSNPVVLALVPSFNGGQPTTMRLKNVNTTSFEVQIDEWNYLDGAHAFEDIDYMVFEAGRYTLADGTVVEAGTLTGNHDWKTKSFTSTFENTPVVFAQSQTYKGGSAIATRFNGITKNDFVVRLQEEEKQDDWHAMETIGYAAFSNSSLAEEEPPVVETGATLFIEQQALPSTDTAVSNEDDINLLRFEATAEGGNIFATSFTFRAMSGSLLNATNYTFWMDTDNNGIVDTSLETGVSTQNGTITFDEIAGGGAVLPEDATVVFEVHADIANSFVDPARLQLAFSTSTQAYVQAEMLDTGASLEGIEYNEECPVETCEIVVSVETRSTYFYLYPAGSLYITKDATPVRSRQLLGGALGESVLRLSLRAADENILLTDLFLTVLGDAGSVHSLALFIDGSTSSFANATKSACGTHTVPAQTFCATGITTTIPEGQEIDVVVRPNMKSNLVGGVSGEKFSVSLDGTATAAHARGAFSSRDLAWNDEDLYFNEGEIFVGVNPGQTTNNDIVGNENTVVMSKITAIANASPDADGTAVPVGDANIGQFAITAAQNSNNNNSTSTVEIHTLIFDVVAENVLLEGYEFYLTNKNDSTVSKFCVPENLDGSGVGAIATGHFLVKCEDIGFASVENEINPGATETFVLQGSVVETNLDGLAGKLQVSLTEFTDESVDSHIMWNVKDAVTSTPFNWVEFPLSTVQSTEYQS